MKPNKHDDLCPCTRFRAQDEFCTCGAVERAGIVADVSKAFGKRLDDIMRDPSPQTNLLGDVAALFPAHEASLHLTHNQHRAYYETIEKAIASGTYPDDCWVSSDQRERALATDSVWEIQWYPDTPVGSHQLLASDLDVLLRAANPSSQKNTTGVDWSNPNDPAVKLFVQFDVEDYVDQYELRGDEGDYSPNDEEKTLLIDAIYGVVSNLHEELRKIIPSRPSPETNLVGDIVPPHCTGTSFVFEPGVLHVRKDGSGYIAVNEEDFTLEDDRDGEGGSVHWIARMDASEIIALRDFLNGNTTADRLAGKIEDLIAEFGDDPKAALECVSEHLQLRRHARNVSQEVIDV